MNNCPSCKKVLVEVEMSKVKGRHKALPPFDCVTLCCPFCGVILMTIPDLQTIDGVDNVPTPAPL